MRQSLFTTMKDGIVQIVQPGLVWKVRIVSNRDNQTSIRLEVVGKTEAVSVGRIEVPGCKPGTAVCIDPYILRLQTQAETRKLIKST